MDEQRIEKIRHELYKANRLDPKIYGRNLVWDHVQDLIQHIDTNNNGYSEQWIDCNKCGLSINPKTITCSACSKD